MRPLFLFLLVALLGALIALSFYGSNGYVLLHYSPYTLETSLAFFVFVLVFVCWGVVMLLRLLRFSLLLPASLREALSNRRNRRAREALVRGLVKLAEGKWQAAENEITRKAPQHDAAVVNYLYAARVAQRRGDIEKRDLYLRQAYSAKPHAEVAVLLTQSELQMEQAQLTQALASLMRVLQLEPGQPRAQTLLVELHARMGDWVALYALLIEVEKARIIPEPRWLELAVRAQRELLKSAAGKGVGALQTAWNELPKRLRRHPELIQTQARLLAAAGAQGQAVALVKRALDEEWNAELGLLFSSLQGEDPVSQLAAVEAWLKQYGEEPVLLLVAGRLCRQSKLWGRARSYLEASFRQLPRPDTQLELGRVFEATNNAEAAQAAYRQGLELAANPPSP
jgi:HemY protein